MSGQRWVLAEHSARENGRHWCDKLRLGDRIRLTDGRIMKVIRVYESGAQRYWEAAEDYGRPISIGHWLWTYGEFVEWHEPREER